MTTLRFDIHLRRMTVLPRLLLLITRLGGELRAIHARDGRIDLTIEAADEVAHRFGPQLARIVEVTALTDVALDAPPFVRNA